MNPQNPPLVVVTAVHQETRAVLDALRKLRRIPTPGLRAWEGETRRGLVRVVQAGIGPERARVALATLTAPHGPVLCVGFAGGLADGAPGDVVLPKQVVWKRGQSLESYDVPMDIWQASARALAMGSKGRVLHGPLLSSPTVLASPREKRAAHGETGAIAVEMETAGLIPLAIERGASVLPLRIVLDSSDVSLEALPPDLEGSWHARIRLLGTPKAWPSVWSLVRLIPTATARLREAVALVLTAS